MKKKLHVLLALALVVALFAGCGSSSSSDETSSSSDSGKSAEGETLTIWMPPFASTDSDVTDEEFWEQELQPLVDETGVTLDIEIVPWDNYETKYLTGISSGEGPDIGYMYMEMFADYIDMGALAPLDDYFTEDEISNYIYYDLGNFDGTQYALPFVVGNPRILVANMDILNEAGITEVPSTLDELTQAAEKIKETNSDVTPLVQSWGDSHYGTLNELFWPYYWAEGGEILDENGEPDVDNDAGLAAAEYLNSLNTDYDVLGDATTSTNSDDVISIMSSGSGAMAMMASADATALTDAGINWDYSTYVTGDSGDGATFVAADSLVLLNSAEDKDLAIEAMKLLTSADVMTDFHEQMYSMPPITEDEDYHDLDIYEKIYDEDADHLTRLPVFENSTTYYDTLYKNLQNMMLGDMTPQEVLDSTQEYYESNIKE